VYVCANESKNGRTLGDAWHVTRSSVVAERPRELRVIEYFAKSLKITQGHSK